MEFFIFTFWIFHFLLFFFYIYQNWISATRIVSIFDAALNVLKSYVCTILCWLWFRSLFGFEKEFGICLEASLARIWFHVSFNDSSWCLMCYMKYDLFRVLFLFFVSPYSCLPQTILRNSLVCSNFFCVTLGEKGKEIFVDLSWCINLKTLHGTQCFIFRFFHISVCLLFDVFPRVEKIRVLTRFLINYFLFSTPLHLPIFISSSAFLFLIERVSCINIHVQNNFNFFSLSLSLSLKQFFQFLPTLESISIQYYYFFPTILEIYTRTLF